MRHHKKCWLILTVGRWPWKLESAKECVTTHLPNQPALKMDGAVALDLYQTGIADLLCRNAMSSKEVAVVATKHCT